MIIRVRSPSDYNTYTNIEIDGMNGEYTVYPTRHRRNDRGEDPTYKAIRNVILQTIGREAKINGSLITVKGYGIAVRKVGNRYTVNGFRCNYNDIMTVVTRVLMRSV